jgi:hypothetical protein
MHSGDKNLNHAELRELGICTFALRFVVLVHSIFFTFDPMQNQISTDLKDIYCLSLNILFKMVNWNNFQHTCAVLIATIARTRTIFNILESTALLNGQLLL